MSLSRLIARPTRGLLGLLALVLCLLATDAPRAQAESAPTLAQPSLAAQLAPRSLRSDSATLVWSKIVAPGSAPAAYEILRDGKTIGRAVHTHYTAAGLAPGHDYVFTIIARPASGDRSGVLARQTVTLRTPAAEPVVSVLEHGAVGDGKTLNTRALQAAIDACPPGGVVRIPKGVFLSGALFLKSDMTLEIAKDGVLKGSSSPDDYAPFIRNRFEGWEMDTHASLLNAGRLDASGPANIRNISIRGAGTISGGGRTLSDAVIARYKSRTDGLRARGRLILLMNAENVEISGLRLEEPSGWTLHYIYSRNISMHGLTIRSRVRNGDGIDPDSSSDSWIFDTTFDTGDDCIAIKSGKNPEGNAINRPTENVRVFDCRFIEGHGISIGSEMSGGVRGVLIEDCVAGPLLHGVQIKATPARGGFVEDVTVRDCDLRQITIYTELPYNNDGDAAPTPPFFRNFRFENIDLTKADPKQPAIVVNGFAAEGHRTRDLQFENIRLAPGATVTVDRAENVVFTGVATADGNAPTYKINASANVTR